MYLVIVTILLNAGAAAADFAKARFVLANSGELAVHVHKRVFHNIAYPGLFFALAVATLVVTVRS